jgi:hypothetical protein
MTCGAYREPEIQPRTFAAQVVNAKPRAERWRGSCVCAPGMACDLEVQVLWGP